MLAYNWILYYNSHFYLWLKKSRFFSTFSPSTSRSVFWVLTREVYKVSPLDRYHGQTLQQRVRDSNPRSCYTCQFSRLVPSTTRPTLYLRNGRDSNSRPLQWQCSILTNWTTAPNLILTHLKLHHPSLALVNKVLVELVSISYRFFVPFRTS